MSSSVVYVCFIWLRLFVSLETQVQTHANMYMHICHIFTYLAYFSRFLGKSLKNSERTERQEAATGCNNIFLECFLLGK